MKKEIFLKLFKKLSELIKKGISKRKIKKNSKGQITKYFDLFVENKIISYLKKYLKIKAEIISEELKKNVVINKNIKGQKYYIIIDPVDGSDNYVFKIPFVCLAIAIFNENLKPVFSFVGNYFNGDYIIADEKKIIFRNKEKEQNNEKFAFVILSGINKKNYDRLKSITTEFKHIRAIGATVGEMMMVAKGEVDTFVDIRGKLTLENFAPFFLISKHTGNILTDDKGQKINLNDLSLSRGYNIVFSKNKSIHNRIIEKLK